MLIDPLPIQSAVAFFGATSETPDQVSSLVLIDLAPGRSVRTTSSLEGVEGKATFSISHSESKENKGQVTDRTSARLDVRRTSDEGVDVVAQATLTVSSPRSGFTSGEVLKIVQTLIGALIATPSTETDAEIDFSTLTRVLGGEP
jgi:hypothetical protein